VTVCRNGREIRIGCAQVFRERSDFVPSRFECIPFVGALVRVALVLERGSGGIDGQLCLAEIAALPTVAIVNGRAWWTWTRVRNSERDVARFLARGKLVPSRFERVPFVAALRRRSFLNASAAASTACCASWFKCWRQFSVVTLPTRLGATVQDIR
jgi:hypothetical protein